MTTLPLTIATGTRAKTTVQPQPFSLPHFRSWASELLLDTGESWHPEPFQEAFLEDVFAGFRECWLIVPEGNAKTTLMAGLALYHAEFRRRAAISAAASSRDQATILYRQAEGFVLDSPRLTEVVDSELQRAKGKRKTDVPRFVALEGYRRVNHYQGSRVQVFAADEGTGDGVIPTLGILDELHRHRNLGLYRTWTGKLGKRAGQVVAISTAGEPGSEFEQTRERIRQSAKQVDRQGSFLRAEVGPLVLHEWAVPENGDVEDFAVVKAANPLRAITIEALAEKFASPTMTLPHWRRLTCNLPTRGEYAAVEEAEWDAARVDEGIPEGKHIWCGLDVAWKWDTTALVPLWMRDPKYRLLGPSRIFVPPRDGTQMDEDVVRRGLFEIHQRNPIDYLVVDPTDARELVRWAIDELGIKVIERPPTVLTRVDDFARFMEALRNGWLKHTGDRGLTQHVLNAQVHMLPKGDPVFERPSQTRQGGNQELRVIDALSAAAMVHALAATPQEPESESMAAWR